MKRVLEWRRWLREHAELSFEEHRTAAFIMETLRAEGIECQPIADTGVLARMGAGRGAVVLRADIDALPIGGCAVHACGHDMHAAALLGALVELKSQSFQGTVFGLFQPGEELLPGGATLVLEEDPFKEYSVKAFYGQHVDPDLPVGVFGVRAGEYMASTDELHIKVTGVGGHGALRALLRDPVLAAAKLIVELIELGNTPDSVLSIGRVFADGATNVVPDVVAMQGTLRTFDEALRGRLHQQIAALAGTETDIEIRHGYPSVINNMELASRAVEVLGRVGEVRMLERRMTGEDFGFYTRRYPSLFYRFGVGTEAGKLHTAAFNPSEAALEYAVNGLVQLIMDN